MIIASSKTATWIPALSNTDDETPFISFRFLSFTFHLPFTRFTNAYRLLARHPIHRSIGYTSVIGSTFAKK
jgi:hypothetical protein